MNISIQHFSEKGISQLQDPMDEETTNLFQQLARKMMGQIDGTQNEGKL